MSDDETKLVRIKKHIKNYPDFPKPGVLFRDVMPLFLQPDILKDVIAVMENCLMKNSVGVDAIVGIESRGFLFGVPLSMQLNLPFIPIRKKGKLPGEVQSQSFSLEYGEDVLEIQRDAVKSNQRVVVVDDLLATGGTLAAACQLLKKIGANVTNCLVIVELNDLNGRSKVDYPINSLITY